VFSTDIRPGDEDAGRELWLADSDGQNAEPLKYQRHSGDVDLDPVWSPRGDLIAFTRYAYLGESGYDPPVIATIPIRTGSD
jgi:hypothetical protein